MSAPLDFIKLFADHLQAADIRFAITSGMACVHFGLQQATRDSDLIIAPEHLERFRTLLAQLESGLPPWRISYRPIFGAPLLPEYLAQGWTSHLSIWDYADSPEHKLDFFGKAPRVRLLELEPGESHYASRHVVALMKRTDRDRDWPMVDGLGWQLVEQKRLEALLHIQDASRLKAAWQQVSTENRQSLAQRRPLLNLLDQESDPDRIHALIRVERIVWECANQERYHPFEHSWKEFYRKWRAELDWQWPMREPFVQQHERLVKAVRQHGLPPDPVGLVGRETLLARALSRAAVRADTAPARIKQLAPPMEELWP